MKVLNILAVIGAVIGLTSTASAAECMTAESVPAMVIALTSGGVSSSGDSLPASSLDDAELVCVRFNPETKGVAGLEFVNLVKEKEKVFVTFETITSRGYPRTEYISALGKSLVVSRLTCPDCNATDPNMVLKLSMLHHHKLLGGDVWKAIRLNVRLDSLTTAPDVDYNGIPFHIMTVKTKVGMGGGAKQIRFSECLGEVEACLKSDSPKLKHLKIIGL